MMVKPEDQRIVHRGGTIGDMERRIAAGGEEQLQPEASDDADKSFEDVVDEVEELIGGKAFYDAETGTIRTEAVGASEFEPEPSSSQPPRRM